MITCEELDLLYTDIRTYAKGILFRDDILYPQQLVRDRMVSLTAKLAALLVSEGWEVTHEPTQCVWQSIWIRVHTDDVVYDVALTVELWHLSTLGVVCDTVSSLLDILPDAVKSHQEWVRSVRKEAIKRAYCKKCWFSDNYGAHCGLGIDLVRDCIHKVIV